MSGNTKGHESLNPAILAEIAGAPLGGGYRFEPGPREPTEPRNPRDPRYDGVRAILRANGRVFARASAEGETYCCGVTLEVWWRAWTSVAGQPPQMDPTAAEELLVDWFCPIMGHSGVVHALVSRGLGIPVALQDAQPGDFIQFWRSVQLASPSGHSAVYLGHQGDERGQTILRYWSSQPATQGLGSHHESIGDDWAVHVVRPIIPR